MATNSKLATETKLSPNRTHPRNRKIDTITIHCVVGQVTAKQGLNLFQSPSRNASCNYVVGKDGSIGLCVDEGDRSWCSGGKLSVNGITGKMNDHRAVTIEVACEPYHPYAVTDAAYEALIRLVADIAKRNGMGTLKWKADKSLVGKPEEQNMTVHRWFANKACPGDYLYTHMGDIAQRANEINYPVQNEINDPVKEEEDMDVNRFKELWAEMRGEWQDNDAGAWSEEARQWAVSTGLIRGGTPMPNGEPNYMWENLLTRQEMATLLYRFAKMMGAA